MVKHVFARCLSTLETTMYRDSKLLLGTLKYNNLTNECKQTEFIITAVMEDRENDQPNRIYYVYDRMTSGGIATCGYNSHLTEYSSKLTSCIIQLMNEYSSSQTSIGSSQDSVISCSGRQAAKNRERELDQLGRANELQLVKRLKTMTSTATAPLGNWVINEIFLKKGYEMTAFDFIELKYTGLLPKGTAVSLNNYKLIAITNCNVNGDFKVDFIVDLHRSKILPGTRLFTVSGESYRDDVSGSQLISTKKQGFTFFRDCDSRRISRTYQSDDPYILLLVHDDDSDVRVTKECLTNPLTVHELKQLKELTVDVVVYHHDKSNSKINRYGQLDLAQELIPLTEPYVLKDFLVQSSIGRCDQLNLAPRQPHIFKSMPPSYMLDPNLCIEPYFLLDKDQFADPSNNIEPSTPSEEIRSNSTISMNQELENILRNLEARVRPTSDIPARSWESRSYFNNDWLQLISPNYVSLSVAEENSNWLMVEQTDRDIRLRCRLCSGHPLIPSGQASQFATDGHQLSQDQRFRNINERAIRRHRESVQHGNIEADYIQRNINSITSSLGLTRDISDEDRIYRVTANIFRTVYGVVANSIPLRSVPTMINIFNLNLNDENAMGYHHRNTRAHVRMLTLVSDRLNRVQFNRIMDVPWTISLDGVSDKSHRYFIIIMVSYLDIDTRSLVVRFFDLVQIKKSTNASSQALAIINQFSQRGLHPALRHQLASMNSDSAYVMRGVRNSVLTRLQSLRGDHVMSFGCANHNLHLAISDSLKNDNETLLLEGMMDDVRQFLNTGYKRLNVYRLISEALGEAALLLHKLSPVKWITSEYDIMRRFLTAYVKLVKTLEAIAGDVEFDQSVRATAKRLHDRMVERDNLLWTGAIVDLLRPVSRMNQLLQGSELSIVDASAITEECLVKLRQILDANAPSEHTPVMNLVRLSLVHQMPDSAHAHVPDRYEEVLLYNSLTFHAVDTNQVSTGRHTQTHDGPSIVVTHSEGTPTFSFTRFSQIIRGVIIAIEDRMVDNQNIRHLNLFRNEIIPLDFEQRRSFADDTTNGQLPLFAYEYDHLSEFLLDYHALLDALIQHPAFNLKRTARSILFWSYFLEQKSDAFTVRMRRIILSVLSVPVSNAVTERAISIMSNAQKRGRNTSPTTLSKLMNVKINGPKVEDFDAIAHAKEWRAGPHWLSDCKYRVEGDPEKKNEDTCQPTSDVSTPTGADLGSELGYCEGAVGGCESGEGADPEMDSCEDLDDV